jgi:hypothetical protein
MSVGRWLLPTLNRALDINNDVPVVAAPKLSASSHVQGTMLYKKLDYIPFKGLR